MDFLKKIVGKAGELGKSSDEVGYCHQLLKIIHTCWKHPQLVQKIE